MKRFLIRLTLFLLPLLILLPLFEYAQRQAPHEFRYKAAFMEAHAAELEVLVLGLSHTHRLNCNYLGRKAFNLCYNNQSVDRDYQLWQRYRDSLKSLRYIVYPLSCWFHQNQSDGIEAWRTPFYTIHYGLPAPPLDMQKRFIMANPKIAVKRLGAILRGSMDRMQRSCDSLGSSLTMLTDRRPDWEGRSGEFMARRHSEFTPENAAENRATLDRLLAECAERGIRVLLVTTPTWHTYYDHLSPEVVARTRQLGQQMQAAHPNVTYIDLLKDKRFTERDFMDDSHLNYDVGGRKLALLLHEYIAADSLSALRRAEQFK